VSWLGARYIAVETRDGTEYLIPNEQIITQQVLNWSHKSERVRLKLSRCGQAGQRMRAVIPLFDLI